jgi:hypothetical protein
VLESLKSHAKQELACLVKNSNILLLLKNCQNASLAKVKNLTKRKKKTLFDLKVIFFDHNPKQALILFQLLG